MDNATVKHLIWKLGGSLEVAHHLNVHQITVSRWVKENVIPDKYRFQLCELATKKGMPHSDIEYPELFRVK